MINHTNRLPAFQVRRPMPFGPRFESLSWGSITKNLIIISICAFINKAGSIGTALFFVYMIYLCLQNTEGALKAISLTLLIVVCNEAFVPKTPLLTVLRFGIWILASARIFYDVHRAGRLNSAFGKPYILALCIFCAVALMLSYLGGFYFQISALKLFSFFIGAGAILIGTDELKVRGSELTTWYLSIVIFSALLGIAAYLVGVGYNAKLEGISTYAGLFNGPYYHPQTLGPAGSMITTFLLCIALFSPYPKKWLIYALIAVFVVFVYMTRSRTGFIALGAGVITAFTCGFFFSRDQRYIVRFNIPKGALIVCFLFGCLGLVLIEGLTGGKITAKFQDLILKSTGEQHSYLRASDLSLEAIASSREAQIQNMIITFKAYPFTGVGFGVDRSEAFVENASMFSAPTEKGFLPIAVFQENGIIGGTIFFIFIFLLYRHLIKDRNIPGICGLSVLLAANLGEMMFFGLGGHGGFIWTIFGACLILGPRCIIKRPVPQNLPVNAPQTHGHRQPLRASP